MFFFVFFFSSYTFVLHLIFFRSSHPFDHPRGDLLAIFLVTASKRRTGHRSNQKCSSARSQPPCLQKIIPFNGFLHLFSLLHLHLFSLLHLHLYHVFSFSQLLPLSSSVSPCSHHSGQICALCGAHL